MNLKNKVALIATSVLTVGTLVVASPALASKSAPKPTTKSVVTSTPAPSVSPTTVPAPPVFKDGDDHKGKGPKGDKGPRGDKGPHGDKGPKGPKPPKGPRP